MFLRRLLSVLLILVIPLWSTYATQVSQQVKLTAGDGEVGDLFGTAVAISGDTAVIGATRSWHPRVLSPPSFRSGLAYVFQRNETTWTQQEKLTPSDGAKSDWFGHAVAVSEDTAVIGAPFHDDEGPSENGGVTLDHRAAV